MNLAHKHYILYFVLCVVKLLNMRLEHKDFLLGKKIVDNCLTCGNEKIYDYLYSEIKKFIEQGDFTDYEFRNKVFEFIGHQATLLINYDINNNIYFLSDNEIKKVEIGMSAIIKIREDIRSGE